jgi:O-acetyl-ADP-ribose deacetylase (regulator of RNase III)
VLEKFLNGRVVVTVGDITEESTDAIVNAANHTLLGGGGVDGAIHRKGGPSILAECRKIRETAYPRGLPTGRAVITTSGDLPSRYVIHTVGPVYGMNQGRDAELLADCYKNSLKLALSSELASISFPSISTGAFGFPRHEAASVASEAISLSLKEGPPPISLVRLVFFSEPDAEKFLKHCRFS